MRVKINRIREYNNLNSLFSTCSWEMYFSNESNKTNYFGARVGDLFIERDQKDRCLFKFTEISILVPN